VSSLPLSADVLPADEPVLDMTAVSRRLGVSIGRARTLVADHHILAVSRDGEAVVPEVFFDDDGIAKHLTGLIEVLLDGGFSRDEAMQWLFTVQDDLGEYPARALHGHSAREMIRRAQALAL
jgi:hypothetical protein